MLSQSSFKERSFSFDKAAVRSSSCSVPTETKKPFQSRRSSIVSVDSDHSDLVEVQPPCGRRSGIIHLEDESTCDSPLTHSFTNPSFNSSKKPSSYLNSSDLLYSPMTAEPAAQIGPKYSAADDVPPDDFYMDDFDIDDLNDSDFPDYFDEPPASTVTTAVKEGGPSKSSWSQKPATPVAAPKPSTVTSPGESAVI